MKNNLHCVTIVNSAGQLRETVNLRINGILRPGREFVAFRDKCSLARVRIKILAVNNTGVTAERIK